VTQLYDDVDDLGDDWRGGRLRPVPAPVPDDDSWPGGADPGHASEPWGSDGIEAAPDEGEPLFEQLRSAYLRRDDTHEWAQDRDGGWADDDSGGWAVASADAEDDDDRYRWVDSPATWEADADAGPAEAADAGREPLFEQLRSAYLHRDQTHGWADRDTGRAGDDPGSWAPSGATGAEDDDRYRWVDAPAAWEADAEAGWDEDLEELDDLEEDEFDPEPPPARARGSRRRNSQGRAGLRRTSTLLNASSILLFAVGALAAAGLTAWILSARLLTTRQLFFLTHSALGIIIVHAFGGGLGTLLTSGDSRMKDRIRKLSTAAMAVVAWLASAVGTWFGYAGYRAKVPPGGNIALYPREYLLHSPRLAFWETFAMEWKVHIGWTTPFLATAVAFTALRYRRRLVEDRLVRKVMTIMLLLAFAGALVAAGLGAVVNVTAPNDFMHRSWSP
jgi:hypothetical protein